MDGSILRDGLPISPVPFMTDFEEAISFKELYKGLQKAKRNVLWKNSVSGYDLNALEKTWELRQSFLNGTYRISEYQHFTIHEPKEREIVATRLKDRQFQRSLCDNILYPQITKGFIHDNCACLKGKGVSFALDRMKVHLQRYYRKHGADGWVLKCDIQHYFPETPHETAKEALRKRVKDHEALKHAEDIIDSFGGEKGIGLGSQVSQLVELAVLDDLDHYIKERLKIRHYIRYMDDFILIHQDREVLENALREIRGKVETIGLILNRKTQIMPLKHGIRFLKWRHILTDSGKVILRIHRGSIKRESKRLKELAKAVKEGKIGTDRMDASFQSWKAHAMRGNTRYVIKKMERLYETLKGEIENGYCNSGTGADDESNGES